MWMCAGDRLMCFPRELIFMNTNLEFELCLLIQFFDLIIHVIPTTSPNRCACVGVSHKERENECLIKKYWDLILILLTSAAVFMLPTRNIYTQVDGISAIDSPLLRPIKCCYLIYDFIISKYILNCLKNVVRV